MNKENFILIFLLLVSLNLKGQEPTIGLLDINFELVTDGYTLFSPWNSEVHYLINNCGEKVHSWKLNLQPDLKMSYLDEEGNLWVLNEHDLYKYDWDGNLKWAFRHQDQDIIAHHDFEIMSNGNFIIIGWEDIPNNEANKIGIDTLLINPQSPLRIDGLYEYKIVDQDSFELVWKWNFKDHFVQEINNTLINFGEIETSPRKLDLNFATNPDFDDFMHCNGLDYNESLDQLIVSSRNSSEIYIIDHSTSIEEAASSLGGNQGYGGDFLWRWGYQNLDSQHDPNWIPANHPNGGMISVFNNIDETLFGSNVKIIDPLVDAQGKYLLDTLNQFLPKEASNVISSTTEQIFSSIMSGAHSLSSGNFILCSGFNGVFYELTPAGEIVWKYQNPVLLEPLPQFSETDINFVFNIKKYPKNYPAFQEKDLSPKGLIEDENLVSEECIMYTDVDELSTFDLSIFPNPSSGEVYFESGEIVEQVKIFAVSGKILTTIDKPDNQFQLNLKNGIYLAQFKLKNHTINKLITIAN